MHVSEGRPIVSTRVPDHAAAFEFPGNSPGVLLIHGFTGDTSEMRPLAEKLNQELGLYCYAPLLPGHGVMPHELHGVTDVHWQDAAHEALDHVRARHKDVIIVSFSMGAALAADMLAHDHKHVIAFVAIAPMISTRFPLIPFTPLVSRVIPWFYPLKYVPMDMLGIRGKILSYDPTLDLDDPDVRRRLRKEVRLPIAVADELRKVAKNAIRAAHHIHVPTLVAQGERDLTLDPHGAKRFFRHVPANDKTLLTFSGADHDFVKRNCRGNDELVTAVTSWIRARFATTR
jgi:carboxylesterase